MAPMNEKKDKRLSIRLIDSQLHSIRIGAGLRNMTISQYVLDAVARQLADDGETFSVTVRTQTP